MLDKIESLENSWAEHGQDYMENHEGAVDIAHEDHLHDWAGDHSFELWVHLGTEKSNGLDFDFSEIEEALIEAKGDIGKAVENLLETARQKDDYDLRSEALTAAERNPGLTGKYSG